MPDMGLVTGLFLLRRLKKHSLLVINSAYNVETSYLMNTSPAESVYIENVIMSIKPRLRWREDTKDAG